MDIKIMCRADFAENEIAAIDEIAQANGLTRDAVIRQAVATMCDQIEADCRS